MSSLFGNLFGTRVKDPELQFAQVDPQTQANIAQQFDEAKRAIPDFAKEQSAGLEASVGRLASGPSQDYAITGVQPGFKDALRNIYSGQTSDFLNKLKLNNQVLAEKRKQEQLKQASRYALYASGVETSYLQSLTDAQNQMEAQRAAIISQISGSVGYAAGTYIGSRSNSVGTGNSTPDRTIQFSQPVAQPASYNATGGVYA
jgi:hypothetical protein